MQYVYVLNMHGEPLMPCSPRKARLLLKKGKALVVKRTPFVIKLLYGSAGYKQPVVLGVDAGSKHIGLSACTETKELYKEELTPRNDVVELMSARRQYRRSRRNRKTRYRAPRFNNRVHSKHKGWLAPSVEVKIQEHITAIKRVCKILPINLVRVETAEFDTQRLKAMLRVSLCLSVQITSAGNSMMNTMFASTSSSAITIPVSAAARIQLLKRVLNYTSIILRAGIRAVTPRTTLLLCAGIATRLSMMER